MTFLITSTFFVNIMLFITAGSENCMIIDIVYLLDMKYTVMQMKSTYGLAKPSVDIAYYSIVLALSPVNVWIRAKVWAGAEIWKAD